MKVLFVCSGNKKQDINPIILAQGESLRNLGIEIFYFTIKGKGFIGYTKNIFVLRKFLQSASFDLIHSHFFLSSLVATLCNPQKIVVSLMGSDIYYSVFWNYLIKILYKIKWWTIIVKTERMRLHLNLPGVHIIPNGVNIENFYPIEKNTAKEQIKWKQKKYILFASSTDRPEKNFQLAQAAFSLLKVSDDSVELKSLKEISHDSIVNYLNSADVLLMTSKYEGSPNIIKEAMACNCPIVSTDVGDVKWIIGNTDGCYIASFNPADVAEKIKLALEFSEKVGCTNGRRRIIKLELDSRKAAERIIEVYKKVLEK